MITYIHLNLSVFLFSLGFSSVLTQDDNNSHDYFTFSQDFYSGCGNLKRCVGFYNDTCIRQKNCKGGFTVFQNLNSLIVSSYNYKDLDKYSDNFEYLFIFLFDPFVNRGRILFQNNRFKCKPFLNTTDGGLAIFRYKKPDNLKETLLYKLYNTTKIQEQSEGWEKYTFLTARTGTEWDNICFNISSNMNKPVVHQGLEFQSNFKFNQKLYYMGGIAGNYLLMTPEIFHKFQESSSYLYQNPESVFFTNFDTRVKNVAPDLDMEMDKEIDVSTTTMPSSDKIDPATTQLSTSSLAGHSEGCIILITIFLFLLHFRSS